MNKIFDHMNKKVEKETTQIKKDKDDQAESDVYLIRKNYNNNIHKKLEQDK